MLLPLVEFYRLEAAPRKASCLMKGSSLGHPGSGRAGEKEETHRYSPAGETYSAVLWEQPRQLN